MAEEMASQSRHLLNSISFFKSDTKPTRPIARNPLSQAKTPPKASMKPQLPAPSRVALAKTVTPVAENTIKPKGIKLDLSSLQDDKFEEF